MKSRFDEFKVKEGWNEDEFKTKRMNEKIMFLKGHLPEFMVSNSKIYSILSVGIHELTEDKCLEVFDILLKSIFFILDEEKQKREEEAARKEVEEAIAKFQPPM